MEEDLSTKAPVTRLRRRLSVEPSEESKSPAPSTPTKKRGARTAKPQLELIEENVSEKMTPRRATRRSIARDTVEEEKPLTPSRRSTRIRSNTSLVLETTQSLDSPRSKRATRRTSQVGSDNEAPTTPARTRKTRKDSATVEKPADTTIITESISEEPEINISQSKALKTPETSRETNISPNSQRKSTRLLAKQSPVDSSDSKLNDSRNNKSIESEVENINKASKNKKRASNTLEESVQNSEDKENKNNLSLSRRNLIDSLETKSPKVANNVNNSTAYIQKSSLTNSKRNRTKSWTTITCSPANETTFFSDSESAKKKVKDKLNSSKVSSEGNSLNKSGNKTIEAALNTSQSKNRRSLKSSQEDELKLNKSDAQKSEIENNDSKKSNISEISQLESVDTKKLFEKSPVLVESKVFIEDSDSNVEAELIGDQCVPNVNHVYVNNSPNVVVSEISNEDQVDPTTTINKANQSIEPMDIDETMPENVVLNDSDQLDSSIDSTSKNKRKSSLMDKLPTEFNQSRRKSSISKLSDKEDNRSMNESKDQSSPTKIVGKDNYEGKNSKRKSSSLSLSEKSMTEIADNNTSLNVSKRKSSSSISLNEEINNSTNNKKSKQKLSLSESFSENNDKSINVSKRKSNSASDIIEVVNVSVSSKAITDVDDSSDGINKSLNKSKLKSSSNSIIENNTFIEQNKSVDNSKRKSSLMQCNLEDSIKSNNENKSTLLLSQINDGSHSPKTFKKNESLNVTTEEQKLNNKLLTTISTSTPLLDKTSSKAIKKHGDVNISDIIPKEKKMNGTNKSILKDISQSSGSESTDDDESSEAGSGLIIDEAEEASDDYESGDSQDEDEKQYEKENEIVERGETITSDEDISNDSDYEKDSFIVSSDEEDNDLLDGSGDDLSMSDKELSMSKKSKKKYNERKLAEQKQASREMYNSRHKLNTSNKDTSKSKSKSKIDSLLLESDDDADKSKSKKNKRLRLDSSHETSAIISEANESIIGKKKKAKRLSESVLENADEKEITVFADTMTDIDPLVNNIKQEPKSARQSLNISTIPFNCVDDVENVQVDENATIINSNELEDPLADDDSESSDNEEIIDNYEILLNNLNKKKNNTKTVDTSLNIDRKSNKQIKEPIVEELNLSVTKKLKKNKSDVSKDSNRKDSLKISLIEQDKEASSDSIDMKLLFAEDSNDSEDKPKIKEYGGEDFIPIKQTQTQTNLQNTEEAENRSFNTSIKKKKNSINFVEDDVCTDKDKQQDMDVSLNTSVKSKKNKKHSFSEESMSSNYKFEKLLNVSLNVSGKQNVSVVEAVTSVTENTPLNESLNTSIKKKNKSLSEDAREVTPNTSTASGKKKKHNKSICEEIIGTPDLDTSKDNVNKSLNASIQNRNNSLSEHANASKTNTSLTASGKKKKKKHNKSVTDGLPETPALDDVHQQNESLNTSFKNKKSKKLSISEEITSTTKDVTDSAKVVDIDANKNGDDDIPEEVPYKSEKNYDNTESHQAGETQTTGKKKRNRKKKKNTNQQVTQNSDNAPNEPKESGHTKENPSLPINTVPDNAEETEGKKSKKRKRKLTASSSTENTNDEERTVNPEPLETRNKIKKQKVSESVAPVTIPTHNKPTETIIQKDNKNKKRKKREEDNTEPEVAKVQKRNSSDKGIPRLPSNIISQLTEKPKKDLINAKRAKIIATTDFEVKENRRTKGVINEGIETVFLNGEKSGKKKNKNKDKLVPFAPVLATSGFGFTTNFQVSVISKETKFVAVAKSAEISNFKHDYLTKKLKKLTTDHMSRRPRSARLSKF